MVNNALVGGGGEGLVIVVKVSYGSSERGRICELVGDGVTTDVDLLTVGGDGNRPVHTGKAISGVAGSKRGFLDGVGAVRQGAFAAATAGAAAEPDASVVAGANLAGGVGSNKEALGGVALVGDEELLVGVGDAALGAGNVNSAAVFGEL